MRTVDINTTDTRTSHPMVNIGRATRSLVVLADCPDGNWGTMWLFMFSSVPVSFVLSSTAESMGLRAVFAVALAFIALAVIDRMKPATPKRPIPVRVENTPTPLYQEPERRQRTRAAASLSAGAVVAGAVVACILGFLLTIALEVVGGLLRS